MTGSAFLMAFFIPFVGFGHSELSPVMCLPYEDYSDQSVVQ